MRLELSRPDYLYETLRQISDRFTEIGRPGIQTDQDEFGLKFPDLGFSSGPADLTNPLRSARFTVRVKPEHYVAVVQIVALSNAYLEGLSQRLEEIFNQNESDAAEEKTKRSLRLQWCPVDSLGTGYFLDEDIPKVSLSRYSAAQNEKDNVRIIALGDLGAETRPIEPDITDFYANIGTLQKISNSFISAVYETNKVKVRNMKLFLDCMN